MFRALAAGAFSAIAIFPSQALASNRAQFTLAATKRCLSAKAAIKGTTTFNDILHIILRDGKGVALTFYSSRSGAAADFKKSHTVLKSIGVTVPRSKAHVDQNVFVSWGLPPSNADALAIESCLR